MKALVAQIDASRSLRLGDEAALRGLASIDAVAVVGATCAGKSTIVDAIRASALAGGGGRFEIPTRYVTRPKRGNDSTVENVHVSPDEFEALVRRGDIGLHWVRQLEPGRAERYGFAPATPGRIPVYSGNNALYANAASVRPPRALARALFLGVAAPDEVREARLRRRSPDLVAERPDEVVHRLADSSSNVVAHVHVVILNHGDLEPVAGAETVALLGILE